MQETKLHELVASKTRSFLPSRLSTYAGKLALGASGGILTAWDASVCTLRCADERVFSLTTSFALNSDGSLFTITNVYAPADHAEKPAFLAELVEIGRSTNEPWVILGDFNLTRAPCDKSNGSFNFSEAHMFNSVINTMELVEIPLLDRAYTWSNKRDSPTLVRLDRCIINILWDEHFPNTSLSSLSRFASDNVPLLVTASTKTPKSCCFRFENAWLKHDVLKNEINQTLDMPPHDTKSKSFIKLLKHCRHVCRAWAKRIGPIDQREHDTKILINALDLLEKERVLTPAESTLRRIAAQGLQETNAEKLAFWRQRFNIRLAMEWDENSRFFHASASGRRPFLFLQKPAWQQCCHLVGL